MNNITIAGADLAAEYAAGASLPDLAQAYDISISTVRRRIVSAGGALRSRQEGIDLAVKDGKYGPGRRGDKTYSPEFCQKISKHRKAWWEGRAKGVRINSRGYLEYTQGDLEGRLVHVIKMEKHLGRGLLRGEVVHHIDGNKTNNDDNNLALMTNSSHARLHRLQDAAAGIVRPRSYDGKFLGAIR